MEEARTPRRVLLVDDEPDLVEILALRLEFTGALSVESAYDGATGLEKALRLRPDAVVLDVAMPGLDGWEVCRRLRADPSTAATPVVIMTAWADGDPREKARSAGASRVFIKPFDQKEFISAVVRYAENSASRAADPA